MGENENIKEEHLMKNEEIRKKNRLENKNIRKSMGCRMETFEKIMEWSVQLPGKALCVCAYTLLRPTRF